MKIAPTGNEIVVNLTKELKKATDAKDFVKCVTIQKNITEIEAGNEEKGILRRILNKQQMLKTLSTVLQFKGN